MVKSKKTRKAAKKKPAKKTKVERLPSAAEERAAMSKRDKDAAHERLTGETL